MNNELEKTKVPFYSVATNFYTENSGLRSIGIANGANKLYQTVPVSILAGKFLRSSPLKHDVII